MIAQNINLEDRLIIVAGVGSGLGTALVHELLDNCNAQVAALGNDAVVLDALRERYGTTEKREKVVVHNVDLTNKGAVATLFETLTSERGPIRGLVHNAVVRYIQPDFIKISKEDFEWDFLNNVYAAIVTSQCAIQHMRANSSVDIYGTPWKGTLLHIGSIVAGRVSPGKPFYGANKSALRGISQYIAHEFGKEGIISICPEPGDILTPRTEAYVKQTNRLERERKYHERVALGRSAQPEEIAHILVTFLDPQIGTHFTGEAPKIGAGYFVRL